jgi:hypothetical protein
LEGRNSPTEEEEALMDIRSESEEVRQLKLSDGRRSGLDGHQGESEEDGNNWKLRRWKKQQGRESMEETRQN